MQRQRKIIHIDMDAFFASVEQRDHPAYRGKPLIVGGTPPRGVVSTCSYEARPYGVHSAMPIVQASRLCPDAIFVTPRFDAYRQASEEIRAIFLSFTSLVEPLSLDEAYLDVTDCSEFRGSATLIAKAIKRRIHRKTALTASAGVSYNKFLAKLASDMDKPDGLYVITPRGGADFVAKLDIGKFHGVGPATEAKMHRLGIHTGADLRKRSLAELTQAFGKVGAYYFDAARGIDHRPVVASHERKSLGAETTFERNIRDAPTLLACLERLAGEVAQSLSAKQLAGKTITLKCKYADFEQVTRSQTFSCDIRSASQMMPALEHLLARTEAGSRPVRLLGVSVSNLKPLNQSGLQSGLFG